MERSLTACDSSGCKTNKYKSLKKSLKHKLVVLKNRCNLMPLYLYSLRRFSRHVLETSSEESMIGNLTMACHGIEKGFTMPDFRPGFGSDRLNWLLNGTLNYLKKYGTNNIQIHHIAKVIHDYKLYHQSLGYKLNDEVLERIDSILSHFDEVWDNKLDNNITKAQYFAHIQDAFPSFSNSRHSIRNFSDEPVDKQKIIDALKIAQNAPSACNRQAARIYVVNDKETIRSIFFSSWRQ